MLKKMNKTVGIILIFLFASLVFYYAQLNWITVTRETIYLDKLPQDFEGVTILQLTDLHSKEFGEGNINLVKKINKIDPNIIVITGDMMTNTLQQDPEEVLIEFLENMNNSYPIYYVTGEHEEGQYYQDRNKFQKQGTKEAYENKLEEYGVIVLNDTKTTIELRDSFINMYGLKDHLSGDIQIEDRLGEITENEVNILLSHRPFYFEEYADWGADLVFSGDTHGGMIRLPFVGGIFSTEGLFPEYDGGVFQKGKSTMVVSRGLGNYPIPLRIFNRPELVVVNLKNGYQ